MFRNLKLKLATRRIEKTTARAAALFARAEALRTKLENAPINDSEIIIKKLPWRTRAWAVVKTAPRTFWHWLKTRDLIGLLNLALLSLIIVLFSILILNILRPCAQPAEIIRAPEPLIVKVEKPTVVKKAIVRAQAVADKQADESAIVLPIKKKPAIPPVVAVPGKLSGEIIIDGQFNDVKLNPCDIIDGNVFIQNMRKYTLPCGIRINGNLVLRNVGLLKFCGKFTIAGNIYVSRNSSFGPISRNARLGGQVIF